MNTEVQWLFADVDTLCSFLENLLAGFMVNPGSNAACVVVWLTSNCRPASSLVMTMISPLQLLQKLISRVTCLVLQNISTSV